MGRPHRAPLRGRTRTGIRHATYGEIKTGEIGLVVDSYGLLSLAVDRSSAAEELGIGTATEVQLVQLDDDGNAPGVVTPVTLREKP